MHLLQAVDTFAVFQPPASAAYELTAQASHYNPKGLGGILQIQVWSLIEFLSCICLLQEAAMAVAIAVNDHSRTFSSSVEIGRAHV